jgi:hypothetical protein
VLPVKSHLMIISIYGSFWKIINCHLPTWRCHRHTLQGGYQRDSSITPPPHPVKVIQPELQTIGKGVQYVIPLSAWGYRSPLSVHIRISATCKRMSKFERREQSRVSGHSANSSTMWLLGARLHQSVATALAGIPPGNGKQDSKQTLSQPVLCARSGSTMLNPEAVLPSRIS